MRNSYMYMRANVILVEYPYKQERFANCQMAMMCFHPYATPKVTLFE